MIKNYENFILEITINNPLFNKILSDSIEYWAPDEVPNTILLADFGRAIAYEFNSVPMLENNRRFGLIEAAMQSKDEDMITAVATGLIEALVIKASEDDNLWPRVLASFGPASRKYVDAWISS